MFCLLVILRHNGSALMCAWCSYSVGTNCVTMMLNTEAAPSGPSGNWISRQHLGVVMQDNCFILSWTHSISTNTVSMPNYTHVDVRLCWDVEYTGHHRQNTAVNESCSLGTAPITRKIVYLPAAISAFGTQLRWRSRLTALLRNSRE